MAAITFDTLRFSKRLRDAGVPERQAEAEAEALSEVFEVNLEQVATKRDLKDLESKIDLRFEKAQGELTLVKWMLSIVVAGILSLVLKAFFM